MFAHTDELRYLIKCAEENGISFVYAISPGLDVVYSSTTELNTLKKKLDQVAVVVEAILVCCFMAFIMVFKCI